MATPKTNARQNVHENLLALEAAFSIIDLTANGFSRAFGQYERLAPETAQQFQPEASTLTRLVQAVAAGKEAIRLLKAKGL